MRVITKLIFDELIDRTKCINTQQHESSALYT